MASISESSRQAEDCNATLDLAIRQLDRSRIEASWVGKGEVRETLGSERTSKKYGCTEQRSESSIKVWWWGGLQMAAFPRERPDRVWNAEGKSH